MIVVFRNVYNFNKEERHNVKHINRLITDNMELEYEDGSKEEIEATKWEVHEIHALGNGKFTKRMYKMNKNDYVN